MHYEMEFARTRCNALVVSTGALPNSRAARASQSRLETVLGHEPVVAAGAASRANRAERPGRLARALTNFERFGLKRYDELVATRFADSITVR